MTLACVTLTSQMILPGLSGFACADHACVAMTSVTCRRTTTKRLKIHRGNIGVMWIIITLMTHAHMECNLKAIMGSVTFLIQSSPRVGAVCRTVSPEPANGNINKMLINQREGD